MLPGTQIRFDDIYTPVVTVQEYLEPTGSCLSVIQTNDDGQEQVIKLTQYTAKQLANALNYFTKEY